MVPEFGAFVYAAWFHVEFQCVFEIVVEWVPFAGLPILMIFSTTMNRKQMR